MIKLQNTEHLYQSSYFQDNSCLIEDIFEQGAKVTPLKDGIYIINKRLKEIENNKDVSLTMNESKFKSDLPNNSLEFNSLGIYGCMKEIISLFTIYKISKIKSKKKIAEELLDETLEKCRLNSPISYGNGLCGIGIGLEYLLQNRFVIGNADEVLSDIDKRIFSEINDRNLTDLTIDNGILGLGYYLYYRLFYRKESNEFAALDLKEHVIYLVDWIDDVTNNIQIYGFLRYELYFILNLLNQLNIFPAKIEKLIKRCFEL